MTTNSTIKAMASFKPEEIRPGSQRLQHAQEQPADDGARCAQQTADYGRHKTLEPQHQPHVVADQRQRSDDDAGDGAQRSA